MCLFFQSGVCECFWVWNMFLIKKKRLGLSLKPCWQVFNSRSTVHSFFYKNMNSWSKAFLNTLTRPTHPLFKMGWFWLYIMFLMRNFSVERSDANLSDMVLVLAINHVFSLFLMRNLSVERSDAKANHTFCHCFMRKAMWCVFSKESAWFWL